MPELPEVETTRRGIAPYLIKHRITDLEVRNPNMRWPIEADVFEMKNQTITEVGRRAKYLLLHAQSGTLILHLGMSGSTRISGRDEPYKKHDHFILQLDSGLDLRLHDPRRFGAVLWHQHCDGPLFEHPRLKDLGPEPLGDTFTPSYLINSCHGKSCTIKQHIMNNRTVVGVGNIYACEALFRSGIRPSRAAGNISAIRLSNLCQDIRSVLSEAIEQGGTTLRDFLNQDGKPGYFKQKLKVYGRESQACDQCSSAIRKTTIGQRSTFFCPQCQR
ncbi:bifunctional DNA-formamidopyrimidine glycosylase/DNA-(apurinic or apyrimidinic site) lyase [Verrucomicrobiaceae bacterium N1E253]|uniref:Formamidopyrimidine-DNA glycosylase n=1 Tax=Oceaniferula marina TaxID=2748318 RepID=A0A851GE98_9BACT|nr:bifunctional DNA-formamidopyrimidine glycosylase/DNA-(apurinic or apyrimidinic site) lyase [Oceaniferula marina]NWK56088.1 bifunctional DNA-formamidopyrimidine glycosylase/DNA-(apurinic or apyrimidinic site) lyase [Oceaniferula marina]